MILTADPDLFAGPRIPVEDVRPGAAADKVAGAWTARDRFAAELRRILSSAMPHPGATLSKVCTLPELGSANVGVT